MSAVQDFARRAEKREHRHREGQERNEIATMEMMLGATWYEGYFRKEDWRVTAHPDKPSDHKYYNRNGQEITSKEAEAIRKATLMDPERARFYPIVTPRGNR